MEITNTQTIRIKETRVRKKTILKKQKRSSRKYERNHQTATKERQVPEIELSANLTSLYLKQVHETELKFLSEQKTLLKRFKKKLAYDPTRLHLILKQEIKNQKKYGNRN